MTNENDREIALDILMEINEKDQYTHVILNEALKKYQYLEKNQRAFISRLVRGTVERRITLDYVINSFSTVKINKMKPLIRNLLRLSVYQMMYMEQIPVSAACNEAVKLAVKRHFASLKGFVNGVLRNIARNLDTLVLPDDDTIKYSLPEGIVSILKNAYGNEAFNYIANSFLTEKKTTILTNTARFSSKELEEELAREGVQYEQSPYVDNAYVISNINYLEGMPSFNKGMFQIQDISSMVAGCIANPKKDDTIIDICAAPGGKSLFAAMALKGTGHVYSRDVSDKKASQIMENVNRLGIDNVTVEVKDATVFYPEDENKADIVIADIPCSGLGIIGRKPDIKYNITEEKMNEIRLLQRRILSVAMRYVKKGGYIVFSTCTLDPRENEDNVAYLLENGFESVDIKDAIPAEFIKEAEKIEGLADRINTQSKNGYITLLPGVFNCDGFFVSKLRRI